MTTFNRLNLPGKLGLLVAVAIAVSACSDQAPTDEASVPVAEPEIAREAMSGMELPATIGSWLVNCDTQLAAPAGCFAQFSYVDGKTRKPVVTWTLGFNRAGELLSEFRSPIDVMIEPGVTAYFWDNRPEKTNYVSCRTDGCLSRTRISRTLLDNLKTDPEVTFVITNADGKEVSFKITTDKTRQAVRLLGL